MLASLLVLAQAAAAPAVPAHGDLRNLFASNDYPVGAHRLNQQGAVRARLTIGTDGVPSHCAIILSSDHPLLDSVTCKVLMSRARFTPARDDTGRPVVDHVDTPPIRWILAGPQLATRTALFSPDDYPKAALLLSQEGTVQAQVMVGTDGKVSECTIVRSSGYSALDTTTCDILAKRAQFTPMAGPGGKPMAALTTTPPITWRIDGNELPVAPWTMRLLVGLKRGVPTNCAIQSGGALKKFEETVVECSDLKGALAVPPELMARFAGRDAVLILDQQFVPRKVDVINAPRDLKKYPLVSRDIVHLSIDPEGNVTECAKGFSEGEFRASNSCDAARSRRFRPDGSRGASIAATASTAIYSYTK